MQSQYEAQLKPIIARYYGFATGLAAFIMAASMLLWRLLDRPTGIASDGLLQLIFVGLVLISVIALPFAGWSLVQARPQAAALLLSAGRNSRVDYRLRRNVRMGYLLICLAAAWFLPILALALPVTPWLSVGLGVGFLALALWNYKRMSELYRQELDLMPQAEQRAELDARLAEVRLSWWTTLLLAALVLTSSLLDRDIQIPPQVPDQWMGVAFITLASLLLANQVIAARTYRRWRQAAQ